MVVPSRSRKVPRSPRLLTTVAAYATAILIGLWGLTLFEWSNDDGNDRGNALKSTIETAVSPDGRGDFSLAREQSFGFFTDITNENWRIAQTYHSKLFPNYYADLNKYSNKPWHMGREDLLRKAKNHFWYAQNFQVEFICPLARRLPSDSMADGPKWVCDPHRLAKKKDCLVYSIGSNGKNEFEKAVKEEIGEHCEIHTFDLESYNKRNGNFADALKEYAEFHHYGLGTKGQARKHPHLFKTLKQTMEELGHTGRTIDIFKIDCEWCEWDIWPDWLAADVDMRQILVETHNAPMPNEMQEIFSLDCMMLDSLSSVRRQIMRMGRGVSSMHLSS